MKLNYGYLATIWFASAGLDSSAAVPATELPPARASAPPSRNIDGIQDNSFLVEEAYNQEPGVVQHILNAGLGVQDIRSGLDRNWAFSFTQEWPLFSQAHQFSYTIPFGFNETKGATETGLADLFLNYRYQVWLKEETLTALAPRFTLILPTGDATHGFGADTVGFQWNLPFSTAIGDFWYVHANAGLTFLPDAAPSPRRDLLNYNLGASAIYALTPNVHLMLEWLGIWQESAGTDTRREWQSVISPGVRRAFDCPGGAQLVVGLAVPIGLTRDSPDLGFFLYLSYEHRFKKSTD